MKKIMLVDDEVLTRENIRQCIDWDKEGFIYCGDAMDGEVALPLIEQWQPQIVITDIKMPFMDGLELASIVRKKYPSIKLVILSGHDEFQYAQRALRIGVEDYCLKPVGADDLIELLNKISKRIDEEQHQKEKALYTRDKFLSDLCGGLISTHDAMEAALSFSIPLIASHYAVAIIDIREEESVAGVQAGIQGIEKQLAAFFPPQITAISYQKTRHEYVYIMCGNDAVLLQEQLDALSLHIKSLTKPSQYDVLLGTGGLYERVTGIHQSYLEAEDNKSLQKLIMQNKINIRLFLHDTEFQHIALDRYKFINFVKLGNQAMLSSFLDEFCNGIKELSWHSSMYGIYLLNELTLESIQMTKQTFSIQSNINDFISRMQLEAKEVASLADCKQYFHNLIVWLWQWRSISSRQYGELILNVKQYIHEHYHNNQLSLNDISKQVGVSPSHLSKVFSQESKQTITEYITETRIQRAMELLKTTSNKTFEIAFDVGYQDQHYFSNIFKKITGMTPIEYRKHGTDAFTLAEREKGRV